MRPYGAAVRPRMGAQVAQTVQLVMQATQPHIKCGVQTKLVRFLQHVVNTRITLTSYLRAKCEEFLPLVVMHERSSLQGPNQYEDLEGFVFWQVVYFDNRDLCTHRPPIDAVHLCRFSSQHRCIPLSVKVDECSSYHGEVLHGIGHSSMSPVQDGIQASDVQNLLN